MFLSIGELQIEMAFWTIFLKSNFPFGDEGDKYVKNSF